MEQKTVKDLQNEKYQLLQTDTDVWRALDRFGCADEEYEYLWAVIEDGKYVEVYGGFGVDFESPVWELTPGNETYQSRLDEKKEESCRGHMV